MDRDALDTLDTLDRSLFFLVAVIGSILLSWLALLTERRQLRRSLAGDGLPGAPSVFPLRLGASALVIGALGFFFQLALRREETAQAGDDPAEGWSARLNSAASTLVLGAALIRLDDLLFTAAGGQASLAETDNQPPV